MAERAEVFRGNLEECLKHFANALSACYPRGLRGSAKERAPMMRFCAIKTNTCNRWLYHKHKKINRESWFRLCCFLTLQGYWVKEWQMLSEERRNVIELVAYGLMTIQHAHEVVGYANPFDTVELMLGHTDNPERFQMLWEIWKSKRIELEHAKAKAERDFIIPLVPRSDNPTGPIMPTGRALRMAEGVLEVMSGLRKLLLSQPLQGLSQDELDEIDPTAVRNILEVTRLLSEIGTQLHKRGG
jgi:hypothetical protein